MTGSPLLPIASGINVLHCCKLWALGMTVRVDFAHERFLHREIVRQSEARAESSRSSEVVMQFVLGFACLARFLKTAHASPSCMICLLCEAILPSSSKLSFRVKGWSESQQWELRAHQKPKRLLSCLQVSRSCNFNSKPAWL